MEYNSRTGRVEEDIINFSNKILLSYEPRQVYVFGTPITIWRERVDEYDSQGQIIGKCKQRDRLLVSQTVVELYMQGLAQAKKDEGLEKTLKSAV